VDSKAECIQLNLAHVARKKKKLTQTNASAHLVQYRFKDPWRQSGRKIYGITVWLYL